MAAQTSTTNAIEQLYTDYRPLIQRYLERLVNNRETAEDLTHETFIKAMRHWDEHSPTYVRAWLYRIATHTAYDYLRRRRAIAISPLVHDETAPGTAWESAIDDAELILAVLRGIPDMYRIPLVLHSCAGYPLNDIAAALDMNVATIKTRIHRARAQFRRHYVA
jgi:RNA polymerase sigma-70 factor (ECF subfamily)